MRDVLLPVALFALMGCNEAPAPTAEASAQAALVTEEDTTATDSTTAAPDTAAPQPRVTASDVEPFLLREYADALPLRYGLAWADLNDDEVEEALVFLVSPDFCGSGGCHTLVLTPDGKDWQLVADISLSNPPITVLESSTNGWRDLTVAVSGGGATPGQALLKFADGRYPANPTGASVKRVEAQGTEVMPEDLILITLDAAASSTN